MTTTKNSATPADDSFELYDLRVEVICPPGERIMCGAKEGDYFTLQGEMMYLPPGQGISVYSLGEDRPQLVPNPSLRGDYLPTKTSYEDGRNLDLAD